MKMLRFKVKGMHCKSCEMIIDDALSELKGVSNVVSDRRRESVIVHFDEDAITPGVIAKAIQKEGYEVVKNG